MLPHSLLSDIPPINTMALPGIGVSVCADRVVAADRWEGNDSILTVHFNRKEIIGGMWIL